MAKAKSKLESEFKAGVIKEIRELFPGCEILHNDANYIQGIPDTLIIHGPSYAMLEWKRHADAKKQANQDYYVDKFNKMSFASFISPENKEAVLNDLQSALSPSRKSRATKR